MKLKPCPHCGSKARFTQYLDPEDYKFHSVEDHKFCWYCGAKMDGKSK